MCYRYKAIVSYDGYDYYGFQHQSGYRTIELELVNAFSRWINKEVKIVGSGRTDKGVHSKGQTIHFDLDFNINTLNLKRALNTFLPIDIRIIEVFNVDNNFHARFSAVRKVYSYTLSKSELTPFNYRYQSYYKNLDYNKMISAAKLLVGTHDFKGLCSADIDPRKPTVKTIYSIDIINNDNEISFLFNGNGFLKYQVRRMMGLLVDIGLSHKTESDLLNILETKDPSLSHRIVPGNGLCLLEVIYEGA